MQSVGIDVGYGAVKWVGASGSGSFASVWCPYASSAESWGIGGTARPLHVDGVPVLVGAEGRPGAHRPFADGRLADPEALPLLAQALWAAGVQGDTVLGSGTPLGLFAQERAAARAALEGRTLRLSDGVSERIVRIARLVLRPQGIGAALHLAAQDRLPEPPGLLVVLDIGTRTTDVATLDMSDLSPVVGLSFTCEVGVATAAESLAASVQSATGHLPPPDLATAALRGDAARWRGVPLPSGCEHLDALADAIRAEVQRRFGAEAGRVVAVAPVGGGAALLADRLAAILPAEIVSITSDGSVFANARGFYAAARRAAASWQVGLPQTCQG